MNETLKRWVDSNTTEFEYALLWLATYDLESWSAICKVANRDSYGKPTRDFVSMQHNAYYEVLHAARLQLPASETAVGRMIFSTMLMAKAVKGEGVGLSEVPAVMSLYDALAGLTSYRQMKALVRESLTYWVTKQRASLITARTINLTAWDAGDLLKELTTEISYTNKQLSGDDHVAEVTSQLLSQKMPLSSGLKTGLIKLDSALGGGFHIGDGNLVIAAPGVGKTAFACQLALHVALSRKLVVYITTEQPVEQLTPRWLSNWCDYPFELVSRGYEFALLPREVQAKCVALSRVIHKCIYVADWKKKKKAVLSGGIEEEIDMAEEKAQMPCSLVLMDWLGGGLTDDVREDKDKKRMALQNTVDRMTDIARNRKICSVAMAQADKKRGTNNMFVGVADVPENHTLDQSMSTVTSITGMLNEQARNLIRSGGSPDGQGLFSDNQFFFISKGRMAPAGHVSTLRKFKFQRFENGKNSV